jgi:hypothetical protein
MAQVLEKEWETYERQRAHLLETHEGKFVLIHGGEVLGVFASRSEARRAGYRKLGKEPFFVQEIVASERPRRVIVHTVHG